MSSVYNALNYVDYDFDRLVQQLITRLSAQPAWTSITADTYRSTTAGMLIELHAYIANLVLYYIERRAQESYLETAQLKSSVINLTRLLNYIPARKVSALGTLVFSLETAHNTAFTIAKYTQCKTASGLKYLTSADLRFTPLQTSGSVDAIQGELVQLTLSSLGTINQEIKINDVGVENTNLFVYVNGALWTSVTSFTSSVSNSIHYKVRAELDDTLTLIFGDNVFGLVPPLGATIAIKYIKSNGAEGNVYDTGKVTTITGAIYDDVGATVNGLAVTNDTAFSGGDEAETIEEIRINAPRVFRTGDRAVTRDDFISIIASRPGVKTSNVWGENELDPPTYTAFNRLFISMLMQDWILPSIVDKANLATYLYTKSMMTVKYEFVAPVILDVVPVITVKVRQGYTLSQSEINITAAVAVQFVLGIAALLGASKRLSDLVAVVAALPEVQYLHMKLEIKKLLTEWYDSYYHYGGILDGYASANIKGDENLRVMTGTQDSDAVQIAHYDPDTSLWVADTGDFTDGTVNLVTGYVGVDANVASGDSVWIRYQQDNDGTLNEGDVLVDFNQICRLSDSIVDITDISYV